MTIPNAERLAAADMAHEPLEAARSGEPDDFDANQFNYPEQAELILRPVLLAAKAQIAAANAHPLRLFTLTEATRQADENSVIDKTDLVDAIYEAAESNGYVETFGPEAVTDAIGNGFTSQILNDGPVFENHSAPDNDQFFAPSSEAPARPLQFVDAAVWDGQEITERKWIVRDRIPDNQVTMLTGDGGTGKTIIALQLAIGVVRGTDWLGGFIDRSGPVIFFTAEEDEPEIHRRCDAIVRHSGCSFSALAGLKFVCRPGEDVTLGAPDARGIIRATPALKALEALAVDTVPALIVVESAADVFAGNENDRAQVRQFIGLLRGMAIKSGAAVLLLGHPSVAGRNTGTGTSGSTGWSNSVRSHLYFTAGKSAQDSDDAPIGDFRQLTVMKANYGPRGGSVKVQWKDGVFVLAGAESSLERVAADAAADDVFLRLLDVKAAQGIEVGPNAGRNYAPSVFADMADAQGHRSTAFAKAMERLLTAGKLRVVKSGPPSRQKSILARPAGPE